MSSYLQYANLGNKLTMLDTFCRGQVTPHCRLIPLWGNQNEAMLYAYTVLHSLLQYYGSTVPAPFEVAVHTKQCTAVHCIQNLVGIGMLSSSPHLLEMLILEVCIAAVPEFLYFHL